MVGDEVLFVTDRSADAAEIALRLTRPGRDGKGLPPLRVGMATGRVLTRSGEVYGPVVNPAARLTSLARPGTALVDAELAAALRADGKYRPAHRRPTAVRGYHHLWSWALGPAEVAAQASAGPSHTQVIGTKSTAHGGYVGSV